MNAIKIDTTIDEAVARAIPALRPLLGRHVELIALDASQPRRPELSVEEFLAARIKVPVGASSVSLDDIENAIAEGRSDDEVLRHQRRRSPDRRG